MSDGTLTLLAANSFSGGTTVSQGVLAVGNDMSLGSGTVDLAGGTLRLASTTNPGIGIKFAADRNGDFSVTGAAGVVPLSNWNNIGYETNRRNLPCGQHGGGDHRLGEQHSRR